ncbi:hypothetical protein [Streptomyces sp. NPDC005970]|uniref:hypothetical protein n=1 Tax=Streptomyces sp. NPDC005970 TaxID=3156723 RepID=UPI0033C61B7E
MKEINACGISTPAAYRPDGLNVWIDLDTQTRPVVDALARRGRLVRPGDLFATGQADRQALRVTTATLTEQRAREFAADLAAVLDHPDAARTQPPPAPGRTHRAMSLRERNLLPCSPVSAPSP